MPGLTNAPEKLSEHPGKESQSEGKLEGPSRELAYVVPKSMPMQNRPLVRPCQAAAMLILREEEAGAEMGGFPS